MTTPQEVRSVSTQIDCMVSNFDAPVDTSILRKAVSMLEELARLKEDDDAEITRLRAELAAKDADVVRLEKAAKWEQYRSVRIGTHSQDCWQWGPEHYVCALREIAAMKENSND